MKETIIKAVTAIVCVAVFSLTMSSAFGKYGEALTKAAEVAGSAQNGAGNTESGSQDSFSQDYTDNGVYEDVTDAITPDAGTDATTPDAGTDTGADTNTDTGAAKPDAGAVANDPTAYTKDQAVRYYTNSMNKSYNAPKVTIKKTDTITIDVQSVEPGGDGVARLANKIVEAYAKTTEGTKSFAKGVATDESKEKASDFSVPVALDPKGAKTATVTKKGNDYEINILVVEEAATLEKFPVYNRQCSFPLNLAAVDLFGLKVTKADFNYSGTKISAVVGADGYVKSAEVYMPLAGSGGGNFIGIKGTATVAGSLKKTLAFTY